MKILAFSGLLAACAMMAACGGSGGGGNPAPVKPNTVTAGQINNPAASPPPPVSNSVDPQGNCTPLFTAEYQSVASNSQALKNSTSDKDILKYTNALVTSCNKFFADNANNITCQGPMSYNGATMNGPISSAPVQTICNQVQPQVQHQQSQDPNGSVATSSPGMLPVSAPSGTGIHMKQTSTGETQAKAVARTPSPRGGKHGPQERPKDVEAKVVSVQPSNLKFSIPDADKFLKVDADGRFLQNGQPIAFSDLNDNDVFCTIVETGNPSSGTKFTGQKVEQNPSSQLALTHVVIKTHSAGGGNASFMCASQDGSDVTVKQMRQALGSYVQVSYTTP